MTHYIACDCPGHCTESPRSALVRPHKPTPRPSEDVLTRAVDKVGPIGLGGVLRELGVSAA